MTNTRAHREAVVYMRDGEWQNAATIFENSVHGRQNDLHNCTEPHTEPARCHNAAGVCWARAGSDMRAMKNFDDAIVWAPSDVRGWYNRAGQHFQQDRMKEALCDVEEAWSLDPQSVMVHELGKDIADSIRRETQTAAVQEKAIVDAKVHWASTKIQATYRRRLVLMSIAPHGGDGYWVHIGENNVPVYPIKSDLVERFVGLEDSTKNGETLLPHARQMLLGGGGGGMGEVAQVMTIGSNSRPNSREGRPNSRDSMRSAGGSSGGGSRPGTPDGYARSEDSVITYSMEVVTADQRAAARRTASRMLVEKHHFLKLPVILGMQQTWLHVPPFARLEDVISCALKEPQLFPKSFDDLAAGPSVESIFEGGIKIRRANMSHMGDQQYQAVGKGGLTKTLAEMLVEQGDALILSGGH